MATTIFYMATGKPGRKVLKIGKVALLPVEGVSRVSLRTKSASYTIITDDVPLLPEGLLRF